MLLIIWYETLKGGSVLALLVKWGNGQMDAGSGHGSATKGQLYDLEGAALVHWLPCVHSLLILYHV